MRKILTIVALVSISYTAAAMAQTAPENLGFSSMNIQVPEHQYPSTLDDLVITNLQVHDNIITAIVFKINPSDVIINGSDVSLRNSGQVIDLGPAQVTKNPGYDTDYIIPVTSDNYQLSYTFQDGKGMCPNRHDGLLPHPCSQRREQYTLTNAANTLKYACVRWSEMNFAVTPPAELSFDRIDSTGLPGCD